MSRQRIAFIDFMKCMCIMLIVMYHIDHEFFNHILPNLNNALQAFRLPMYYFISGIFFKRYGGFADFTRRKVNNILVPFCFFIVLAYGLRLAEWTVRWAVGAESIDISPIHLVEPFFMRYWDMTTPIWFLLSLFWCNVIYYAMQRWLKSLWLICLVALLLSVIGYLCGIYHVLLPLMLDTSLVAIPYFILGHEVNRLGALRPSRYDRWGIVALLLVALPIYLLSENIHLLIQALPVYWKLYLLPFVAIMALFWACKPLPHIPVLCHYGRYSLIILGTHTMIYEPLRFLFVHYGMAPGARLSLLVFCLTMLIEWPVIWLLKTWAPRFTAQEPFFHEGWSLRRSSLTTD